MNINKYLFIGLKFLLTFFTQHFMQLYIYILYSGQFICFIYFIYLRTGVFPVKQDFQAIIKI
jgi:hypothetical protein